MLSLWWSYGILGSALLITCYNQEQDLQKESLLLMIPQMIEMILLQGTQVKEKELHFGTAFLCVIDNHFDVTKRLKLKTLKVVFNSSIK